jgi:hypothetical protein
MEYREQGHETSSLRKNQRKRKGGATTRRKEKRIHSRQEANAFHM